MLKPPPESTASPESAATLLRRLEWTTLRRLDGLLQGDYRTLFRGAGLDLADLREYQPGDDVRHMDWNVSARLQVPHVRVFTEDRELAAWFLLDLSASVDFGSTRSKRSLATSFCGLLARALTRQGNRVGALMYGHRVDTVLPARNGRQQVLQILHRMSQRPPAAPNPQGTRLDELLSTAVRMLRRRSLVFVMSDFISEPGWVKPLAELARRHDVVAVRLFDPLELELPPFGVLVVQDAETGEQRVVDTEARGFLKRFADLARAREASLREDLARAGVDTLELATTDDLSDAVLRFVTLRKQRSQLVHGGTARRTRAERRP